MGPLWARRRPDRMRRLRGQTAIGPVRTLSQKPAQKPSKPKPAVKPKPKTALSVARCAWTKRWGAIALVSSRALIPFTAMGGATVAGGARNASIPRTWSVRCPMEKSSVRRIQKVAHAMMMLKKSALILGVGHGVSQTRGDLALRGNPLAKNPRLNVGIT